MSPLRNAQETMPQPRRRDVLAYGVYGAGLALLPSASWAAGTGREGLMVGYCPEAPAGGWLEADGALAPDVVPASRLAGGETELARHGARVTIHGLAGGATNLARLGIRSAELKVGFPVAGADPAEFRAWSHQLLPVENAGTAIRFTVPAEGGLHLALELESFGVERRETVLVTGREPGAPKLRSGQYLIAVDPTRPEPYLALSVEPADETV